MAHFAELDSNKKVLRVIVVHNNELLVNGVENEQKGIDFCKSLFGSNTNWVQTSYNTFRGIHKLGGIPLRKNYAGMNYTYDQVRDAFISPKPFNSWTLDENTCDWEAPTPFPSDGNKYVWNEQNQSWDLISNF